MQVVESTENKLFASWSNQEEIKQYIAHCKEGPVHIEDVKHIMLLTKAGCAREYSLTELASAIERAHSEIPAPPAPLKYL